MLKRYCDICGEECQGEREAQITGIESVLYDLGIEDSCAACLNAAGKVDWARVVLQALSPTEDTTEPDAEAPPEPPHTEPHALPTEARTGGYTGFLFIRCEQCGAEKAFCAKAPLEQYECECCGAVTPLASLATAEMFCECGNHAWYKTNVSAWGMDIPCVQCHAPVSLEYRPGKDKFMTIESTGHRRGT